MEVSISEDFMSDLSSLSWKGNAEQFFVQR